MISHKTKKASKKIQQRLSDKAILGGILIIIGGALGLIMAATRISLFEASILHGGGWMACGTLATVLCIVAISGSIIGLIKKNWNIAMIGGICAILTLLTPSMILGIIGTILIFISGDDFP